MLFKFLFLLLSPLMIFASPGYNTPWGKDTNIIPKKKTASLDTSNESTAVFISKKIILFHQKVLSPVDGPRSHFYPCSSQYMKIAMIKHGFFQGFIMGCDRLMRENKEPWTYRNVVINGELIKYDPPR